MLTWIAAAALAVAAAGVWLALHPRLGRAMRHLRALRRSLADGRAGDARVEYGELRALALAHPREAAPSELRLVGARTLLYHWKQRKQWTDRRYQPVALDGEEAALAAQIFDDARSLAIASARRHTVDLTAEVLAALVSLWVALDERARAREAFGVLAGLRRHCGRCAEVYSAASHLDGARLEPPT